jgi:NitT/TauT family transport system substrate-binding protein
MVNRATAGPGSPECDDVASWDNMAAARGKQPAGAVTKLGGDVARAWFRLAVFVGLLIATGAMAADRLRIAAQKTGTLAWELDVIRAHGLAQQAGLDLEVTELAAPEAGKLALEGGSADVILSDVMWVARERALGGELKFSPYSSTLGAIMVPHASTIASLNDLAGRKLGIAGGPLDKSWLMLRALASRDGLDLAKRASIAYGAPKLLAVKAEQGELDATLNYWNLCADLETLGFRRLIDMREVQKRLGAKGAVAMVGYAFKQSFAEARASTLQKFLDVSAKARDILVQSPDEWTRLAPRIGATSEAALAVYRARYSEGATRRPLADEEADARALYRVLAETGGASLVGPSSELDPGTYWHGPPGNVR